MVSLVQLGAIVLFFTVVNGRHGLDLTFTALNLNITLKWTPLDVTLRENESIYYTVIHDIHTDVLVPNCINITQPVCNLVHLFATINDIKSNEYFKVKWFSNRREKIKGTSGLKTFSTFYLDISGPVIYRKAINARNVTVWVHGPFTPFSERNVTLYIGQNGVASKLNVKTVYFMTSLSNLDDPDTSDKSSAWQVATNGTHRFTYTDLKPYTRYVFTAHNKLGRYTDEDPDAVVTWTFRTTQDAPEFGPYVIHNVVTRRSCDVRDIQLIWQERTELRSNVDLTHYVITCEEKKSGNKTEKRILTSNRSTILHGLYRWTDIGVTVRSVNSHGNAKSEVYTIPYDEEKPESYRVMNMTISKESAMAWRLTWDPPSQNVECIVGYNVSTFINGALEDVVSVGDVQSTPLYFQRVGRYIVDLVPVVNNSIEVTATTTIEYNATDLKLREWAILVSVMILICVILTAVIVMARKVFCDLSALPDLSKTFPVRLASTRGGFVESLKSPPEKEFFHATRSSHTSIIVTTHFDDDVFEPKSTSSCQVTTTSKSHNKSTDEITRTEANKSHDSMTSDSTYLKLNKDTRRYKMADTTVEDTPTTTRIRGVVQPDGYVSRSISVKAALTVYIPNEDHSMKPGPLSPQSSSADSGISSSAYTGSLSDYVPASPFSDTDTSRDTWCGYDVKDGFPYVKNNMKEGTLYGSSDNNSESPYMKVNTISCNSDSYGYDFQTESPYVKSVTVQSTADSPYVKSELAGQPGKIIQSTSQPLHLSSTKGSTNHDDIIEGYLPMTSSTSCSDSCNKYSKLSPKN